MPQKYSSLKIERILKPNIQSLRLKWSHGDKRGVVMSKTTLRKKTFLWACSVLSVVSLIAPSQALAFGPTGLARSSGQDVVRVAEQERSLAPFASVVFCMQSPDQCRRTKGEATTTLDARRKQELASVNSAVNRSIGPQNDRAGSDNWAVDVTRGDCEDYALTKRKKLIALGWSSGSLRIAVALTSRGEGHAVVIAKTSEGDLVLDNRTNSIKDWRQTDLQLLTIQSHDDPKQWYKVGRAKALVAAGRAPKITPVSTRTVAQPSRIASDIGNY